MNVTVLMKVAKLGKNLAIKYAPEILTGLGCAGVALTTTMAVRDSKKHLTNELDRPDNRRKVEVVLDTAHDYAPTITAAAVTMATIILSNRISAKRLAGLAATLAATQKQLTEFKAAAREIVGPDQTDKIESTAKRKFVENTQGPILRWKESISGDEFYAPEVEVLRAEMEIERRFHVCHVTSINELRHELNLGPLSHDVDYVWDQDDMREGSGIPWISFWHSHEIDMKGEYRAINYHTMPIESMA